MKKNNILLLSAMAVGCFAMAFGTGKTVKTSAYYDPDESDWENEASLLEVNTYQFDESGNQVLISNEKFERTASGKPLTITTTWYEETGEDYSRSIYEYDANENCTRYEEGDYSPETGEFTAHWGDIYQYDANNNCTLHAPYGVKTDGSINYSYKYVYEYNDKNQLVKEDEYIAEVSTPATSIDDPILSFSTTYEYYENGLTKKVSDYNHAYVGEDGGALLTNTHEYEYNSANLETKMVYKQFNESFVCFNSTIRTMTYNSDNKLTESRSVYYTDDTFTSILSVMVDKYTYDGNEVTSTYYVAYTEYQSDDDLRITQKIVDIKSGNINESRDYDYSDGNFVFDAEDSEKFVSEESNGRIDKVTYYRAVDETTWEEVLCYVMVRTVIESNSSFPWWIIIVIVVVIAGAYGCGYYFYNKEKLKGKFFDTIYTWLKNLLTKKKEQ